MVGGEGVGPVSLGIIAANRLIALFVPGIKFGRVSALFDPAGEPLLGA